MSRCEKKLKDKMDDEIKLAGMEALVREVILNSNLLRTLKDARLEIVTFVEAKFGKRTRGSKPSDTVRVNTQIPWMLGRSVLSHQATVKGHRVRAVGVSSAVEHIFNETAMHARALASNRLANRASHGPRVRAKERVKRTRTNPKESPKEPKVPKAHARVKHRELVSHFLKTRNQRQARKLRNLDKHVPLTRHGFMMNGVVTNGTIAGVRRNGLTIGVLFDGMKVGNKRTTHLQAHFHLEAWISVPRVVQRDLKGRR